MKNSDLDVFDEFLDSVSEDIDMQNLQLDSQSMQCPYCWENFEWICDDSDDSTEMIEDCPVCCRPIHFKKITNPGFSNESEWQALSEEDFYE